MRTSALPSGPYKHELISFSLAWGDVMRVLRHREIEEPVEVSEGLQVELRHSCPRVCVLRATLECLLEGRNAIQEWKMAGRVWVRRPQIAR